MRCFSAVGNAEVASDDEDSSSYNVSFRTNASHKLREFFTRKYAYAVTRI
jgi:hypothetical protein